jgi:hypothetical protein
VLCVGIDLPLTSDRLTWNKVDGTTRLMLCWYAISSTECSSGHFPSRNG